MGKRKWNKQIIIDAIREHERRGLSLKCLRKDKPSLESAGRRYFGSWRKAVLAAGVQPFIPRVWSKEVIVARIKERHQRGLPIRNVRKYDAGLVEAAGRYFGSWLNAMSAAGLEQHVRKTRSWSKQSVIEDILDRKQRGLPLCQIFKRDRRLGRAALRHFGSWDNAISAAGLRIQTKRIWSKEKVIEQIQWWHSRGISPSKIYQHESRLRWAGRRYFGSWDKAVQAAGLTALGCKWSKELVIKAIKDRQQQGLSLRNMGKHDRSLLYAAQKFYGGWQKALMAANVSVKIYRKWNSEIVIKEIQARYQQRLPMTNLAKHDTRLGSAATMYFGGWNNALLAAGLEPNIRKWNRQRVIDEIKAWHARGLPISKIRKDYENLTAAGIRHFGSWHNALKAAGFESRPQEKWSQERVIRELQAWYKEDLPKAKLGSKYPGLLSAVQRYYGYWDNALKAAGLEPKRHGRWSRERVVQAIQDRHVQGLPTGVSAKQDKKLVYAAQRYFGGWANALEAAGVLQEGKKPKRPEKWSAQRVIAKINARHEKGLALTTIQNRNTRLAAAASRFFGSWDNAMVAAGFQSNKLEWNKNRIIAEIRIRHSPDMGTHTLGMSDMNLYSAAKSHFGSWPNAMRAAGFTPETVKSKLKPQWSKQRVVNEMQVRHHEGLFLTCTWPANRFLASAATRYFGNWHNALRAAGISPEEVKLTWQKKYEE